MKFLKNLKGTLSLAVSKSFLKKTAVFFGVVLLVILVMELLPHDLANAINAVAWVLGNVLLAYTSFALITFLIAYYTIFDPSSTTGGRLIFRFMLSLAGVIVLIFVGIYVDPLPDRQWSTFPAESVDRWRPLLRLAVYGFVAFSISSLAWLLAVRKWWPHKVKKASDINLVKVRHTNEIPIIKAVIPELIHEDDAKAPETK